ncbi:MAG: hypothetical protein ACI3XI_04250 [Eubacteriales bacterium]
MKSNRLLNIIGEIDDRHIAEAAPTARKARTKPVWIKLGIVAACMVLLICTCFGAFAVVAEAEEYKAAVHFFNDYGMSPDGLTREEIKAVYRDITTKSFTYYKTAEVIRNSISVDHIGGYEIMQDDPTPEDVKNLWNYKNYTGGFIGSTQTGVHYKIRSEYKEDETLGFAIHDKSYIEKYDGDELIWSVSVSDFYINDYSIVSDGVIACGRTYTWSTNQNSYAWMSKIDSDGNLIWQKKLSNGFNYEYISAVLENIDGSYAVFSRGDFKYFCLSQYTANGEKTHFHKTEVGNYGIWNAARFEDGYIVQLGRNEFTQIVKVDRDGYITDSFSYCDEDSYYFIADMIEFNGNIYLSAYAVPRLSNEEPNTGGRYEIENVLKYLFDNKIFNISSEELTPMVRNNYTALLLVCEPKTGKPQEFYSVKGSLGGKLSVSDTGNLLWNVESITSTFFSPATSSFTIGGTNYVFRYAFDTSGLLISQEKTGEVVNFRR